MEDKWNMKWKLLHYSRVYIVHPLDISPFAKHASHNKEESSHCDPLCPEKAVLETRTEHMFGNLLRLAGEMQKLAGEVWLFPSDLGQAL